MFYAITILAGSALAYFAFTVGRAAGREHACGKVAELVDECDSATIDACAAVPAGDDAAGLRRDIALGHARQLISSLRYLRELCRRR